MASMDSNPTRRLDPLRFPLHGQRLIEASAGTGKTFTLALLYTRLVLGHGGDDHGAGRAMIPPEILVVTFTDAATKELRARIRERLVEAADFFDAAPHPDADSDTGSGVSPDDPLWALRADYPVEHWPGCARRLRRAADWMDEAVIATIHGFCQRMLQEHAFSSRGLFQRELITDQSDLVRDALNDYWRLHCYPLSPEQAICLAEVAPSPDALHAQLDAWLRQMDAPISHCGQPVTCDDLSIPLQAQCKQRALEHAAAALQDEARRLWREHRAELEDSLRKLRPHLNGTSHQSSTEEKFQAVLAAIGDWSQGNEEPGTLKNLAQGAFKFKKTAPVQQEPEHPAFAAIARWKQELARIEQTSVAPDPPLAACLQAHAAAWLKRELPRRLGERAEMGFDDLLRDLDAALTPKNPDSVIQTQAQALAATLRRQFPVALIDEFQDTDPLQYRIFTRIYGSDASAPADPAMNDGARTGLILIGDPKQAIYGFRGADIHAYLAARQAASHQVYSLDKNFRSTQGVVNACNRLFTHAEQHKRGAFRFRDSPEADNPIPFLSVSARGRDEQLILNGQPASAMTLWWRDGDGEPMGPDPYRQSMAEAAASEIVRWLTQTPKSADQARSGFVEGDGFRPLQPSDIAILVRTGTEAEVMRTALAERLIHSVYLSDRGSVLDTREAADLLHWLQACAAPHNESLVKTALATNTLALPMEQFARWQNDELAWEIQLERFRGYQALWRHQGILAMLRRLLHDAELPARLLANPGGERRLTNLLHLAEWLQQASTGLDGEQALIRHLRKHAGQSADELILRLESDADLVRVITIHKAKGLEYPLVLLPFICSWRPVTGRDRVQPYRPDQTGSGLDRYLEVAGKKQFPLAWDQADDERLSEDMRLLYVAVTRARHALWLGIAPLKQGNTKTPQLHQGAIGYALSGGTPFPDADSIHDALLRMRADCPDIRLCPLPKATADQLSATATTIAQPARTADHRPFAPWWIASYSALRRGLSGSAPDPASEPDAETAQQETALEETASTVLDANESAAFDEPAAPDPSPPESLDDRKISLHKFPRGSRYGTFLHGLLEWAGNQSIALPAGAGVIRGFAAAAQSRKLRHDMLARRCKLRNLDVWIDPLNDWLGEILNRPWQLTSADATDSVPLVLARLEPSQARVEMEFWIQARQVKVQQLDALVTSHCLPGQARPALSPVQLNGMLKGFIDLVLEHQGRYYVLDWKSNHLGPDDKAYSQAKMRAEVLHHRYDLQYLLYLLALHRLLRSRLPDYDYDRHIGGALYVFLRGGNSPTQGLFSDRPPRLLIDAMDGLFAGSTRARPDPVAEA